MEKRATHYTYETTIKIKKSHFLAKIGWDAFFYPMGCLLLDFFGVKKGTHLFQHCRRRWSEKKIFYPEYVRQPQAASPGSKKTLFHVLDCLATESWWKMPFFTPSDYIPNIFLNKHTKIDYLNGINFRELKYFAFREDLLSRIGYAEKFWEY